MAGGTKNSVDIEVRSDGVYLVVDNTHGLPKITRQEVLKTVEDNGIMGIDFLAISEMFKRKEDKMVQKISSNKNISQISETATIEISQDKLSAAFKFIPPKNCDTRMTKDEALKMIESQGLTKQIDYITFDKIFTPLEHSYTKTYPFAYGVKAVDGIDGYLEYHFDVNKNQINFKELEDGSMNLKELDIIELAYKDQVLVTSVEPISGVDGVDVFGNPIFHKPGKPPKKVPRGKNVYVSEDEKTLISSLTGELKFSAGRISVFPTYEVRGNVDNSVGNIKFNGIVIVDGDVLTEFKIITDGEVAIKGVLEGAVVKSGEDIIVTNGIQGRDKALVVAGAGVRAKFVENATIIAEDDIEAAYIMHSNIKCNGSLKLGNNSTLVGGRIQVQNVIEANVIGSPMSTKTEIFVGHETRLIDLYAELKRQLAEAVEEYKEVSKNMETLSKVQDDDKLTPQKRAKFVKEVHKSKELATLIKDLRAELEGVVKSLDTGKGEIKVTGKIHPGVSITLGNAVLQVKDVITKCTLVNRDGKVVILKDE